MKESMENTQLNRVQMTQLEIACEIKRICKKHNIKYFMDGGTLLGAVRHKGFIPWDDDMDFGMMREEYNRFIKVAPTELDKNYFLQTWETDKEYSNAFAKIRKNNTVYLERVNRKNKAHAGIFVDIFPYDNYPEAKRKRNVFLVRLTILKMMIKVKSKVYPWLETERINYKRFVVYLPILILSLFFRKKTLIKEYQKIVLKYTKEDSSKVFPQVAEKLGVWVMDKTFFDTLVDLPFESETFLAPSKFHDYLVRGYGDYMTPTPQEKRMNYHNVIRVEFDD